MPHLSEYRVRVFLGFTLPLREVSTRNIIIIIIIMFLGSKVRRRSRAGNLTAISEPTV
jgi:hypothetical protein